MGKKFTTALIDLSNVPKTAVWYTVVTQYNYEKKFANDLLQGIKNTNIENNIEEVIVPFKETKYSFENKQGKTVTKTKTEKQLPLYVFVKAIMNGQVWDYIRNTSGAVMILTASGNPLITPEHEIDNIRNICNLNPVVNKSEFNNNIGDDITIISGPFSGYTGVIKSINKQKSKLAILLHNNGSLLEINIGDVS